MTYLWALLLSSAHAASHCAKMAGCRNLKGVPESDPDPVELGFLGEIRIRIYIQLCRKRDELDIIVLS